MTLGGPDPTKAVELGVGYNTGLGKQYRQIFSLAQWQQSFGKSWVISFVSSPPTGLATPAGGACVRNEALLRGLEAGTDDDEHEPESLSKEQVMKRKGVTETMYR